MEQETKKNVVLVLSSGGPRGFAYIGAIEALLEHGYTITSVAGTSIGSLVGGIYVTGRLPEFKEWLFSLDSWDIFSLMDLSISKNHFVKGDKIINAIKEIVPEINIEDLPIPYRAIATDLYTGQEVVFDKGKLFTAIRASISIPSLFKPVKYGMRTLIDGAIANSLPVNRVARTEGDIVVAFDVNHVNVEDIQDIVLRDYNRQLANERFQQAKRNEMAEVLDELRNESDVSLVKRLKHLGSRSISILREVIHHQKEYNEEDENSIEYGENYYDLLERTFNLMNHKNTELSLALHKPDILVRMPFDSYGDISDYAKAREISDIGYRLMSEALERHG